MDSTKPSSSLAESLLVDSDSEIHRQIPLVPRAEGFGEVKQIELQNLEATICNPAKPYEVIHHGTFGIREEVVAAYDDAAAALHFKGPKAKLKGKLHPEPSTGLLSPGNEINHALTSSDPGTSKTCDGIMSFRTTPDFLSPGSGQNIVLSSGSGYHITTTRGSSSEIITCSARMLPCLRCQSTNTKFWFYDISSNEPHHLCKDCRLLWNADILTLDLSPEVNHASETNEVSIDMPSENEMVPNKPPGAETTRNISVFKGFVDAARPRLERILGDSKIVKVLIMVIAEAGFALVTYGSGANTSMMPNERILLDIAGVSSIVGFLCCLSCLLLRGVRPGGALILAGLGFIAVVIGFLALMGMLWI